MFGDESVDSALERINEWERSMARRAETARELARRTSEMSATARSRDGLVAVTVDAQGELLELFLDERTRRQSAAATAQSIVETLRAAKQDLARQFESATADTVGLDSETGRMLSAAMCHRLGQPVDEPGERR